MTREEFWLRVLNASKFDLTDFISWEVDGDQVKFFVDADGTFTHQKNDREPLTEDNIEIFEQAIKDANEAEDDRYSYWGATLFCARVKKMRPFKDNYKFMESLAEIRKKKQPEYQSKIAELFNACGPERDE